MPHTIFLIDDDEVALYLQKLQLDRTFPESEINSFKSTCEALSTLEQTESSPPCLVLIDVNLPVMDAWEFMDTLKARNIPLKEHSIFLLSSDFSPNDLVELNQRGLENRAYQKPLDEKVLEKIMRIAG